MNKEKLISAGINYDEGVHRFSGKADLYEKYLRRLFEKDALGELREQLAGKNFETAFRLSHSLKGTTGSLSVNKLYTKICTLTDALRTEPYNYEEIKTIFDEACTLYETAKRAVEETM